MPWIDTHCHLDAPEFGQDHWRALAARAQAAERGVALCVLPAVGVFDFDTVRAFAHRTGDAYALGIHPLLVPRADDGDLERLDAALAAHAGDPRLVAVGEIGLDFFVPELTEPAMRARQLHFFRKQLQLARRHGLPVIVHTRRSVDQVLRQLREVGAGGRWEGIAHAFNGSLQQAQAVLAQGLKLGFGGAMTFDTARQLRQLATELPLDAIVMETDAPDIPPQWLYVRQSERAAGRPQGLNTPAELPRIAETLVALRGLPLAAIEAATTANALVALPRLRALWQEQATIAGDDQSR
ncbi:TatD family hydrolase [Pseudorhodoferax sp. Leaf265]|uniref:TatD family hydrolase n=1 Tax=Pseudorhodoferax sp. Leaf265 TaxID=1736315 RepID=UPI000700D090|nr:TatD family hydrolase [Pseudorhodoferax sp. Leaf265]KQP21128.1 DNAase [Pseudorhodoferax sp. Leaf265]PZP92415.1 MAG: TatD family deoxyribonuclease [Variovorax paradoxus]PZQ02960.1 MAG: TatD family deoxyribonuclease [Variovorax paradoxus]